MLESVSPKRMLKGKRRMLLESLEEMWPKPGVLHLCENALLLAASELECGEHFLCSSKHEECHEVGGWRQVSEDRFNL